MDSRLRKEKGYMSDKDKIYKLYIIRKSNCFKKLLFNLIIAIIFLSTFLVMHNMNNTTPLNALRGLSLALSIAFFIIPIKHIPTCIKIVVGKYKIKIRKLLGKKFRYMHEAGNNKGEILDFGDVRITVDNFKAGEFSVGDKVVLVFVDGVKYPVVIEKLKK